MNFPMFSMTSLVQRLKDLRYKMFYGLLLKKDVPLTTLCAPGSICPWTISTAGLNPLSVVYAGGVGSDITFEHELVRRFGCRILLFDPSPTGLKTMALPENAIPQFRYVPKALAAHSGFLLLAPPKPGEDSWMPLANAAAAISVPCIDLASLMSQSGDDHIDLLKLDIEGSEYEVIDDLLHQRLAINQICVEFHHGLTPGIRRSQTIRAILSLRRFGYKLVCQEGANHTFILDSKGSSALKT